VVVSANAPTQVPLSAKLPEAGVLGGEAFPPPPAVVSAKPPARPVLCDKASSALASPVVSAISSMQLPRGNSTPRSVAASSFAHFDSPLRSPSEATASAPVFTFTSSDHTPKSPARGVEPTFGGVRDIARSWPLRVVSPTKLPAKIVGPVTGEPSSARGSTPLSKTMDPVSAGETFLAVLESPKPLPRTTGPVLGGETLPTEATKPLLPKAMTRVQSGDAFPAMLESTKPLPAMAPVHSAEVFPTEAAKPLLPKAMARVQSGDAFPAVLESAKPSPRMAPVHSETFPAALEAAKSLPRTMALAHSGDASPAVLESAKPLPKIMAPVRSGEASPAQACRIAPMGVSTKLPAKTIEPALGAEATSAMSATTAASVMPPLNAMEPVQAGDAFPTALEPTKPLAMTMVRAHSGEAVPEVLPKPVPQTIEPATGGEPFPALLAKLKTAEPVLGEEGPLTLESAKQSPKTTSPKTTAPNVEPPAVLPPSVVPAPEVGENGRLSGSSGERDDTFPSPPPDEPWMQLRRKALPTKSPEDNYELSDGGGDSEAEEPRERGRKFVPAWCKTYLEDLQKQVDVDPDSIFGNRVPQCCLEDIFTDAIYKQAGKSRPRRRRGSSGNWSRDPLTYKEVTSYKERIGHHRGWEEACMCAA